MLYNKFLLTQKENIFEGFEYFVDFCFVFRKFCSRIELYIFIKEIFTISGEMSFG